MVFRPLVFGAMVLISGGPAAWATPPSSIELTYDSKAHLLRVSARHPSDRRERHFLRKLDLYVNGALTDSLYFPRQKLAYGLEENVEVAAEGGDTIEVELFCSQGGNRKAQLSVPVETQPNDENNPAAVSATVAPITVPANSGARDGY